MTHIDLSSLAEAIGRAEIVASPGTDLAISTPPTPYIAPALRIIRGNLRSEIISIQAPAAVGKSVTAHYLSAMRDAPLLNLANVQVSTGSFSGIVDRYIHHAGVNPTEGHNTFHRGGLPIIIDAIDEGVLRSGEEGIEGFLQSAAEFIARSDIRGLPKIVLLGRDDSVLMSNMIIEECAGRTVRTCETKLDYFNKESAFKMIDIYSEARVALLPVTEQENRRRTLQGEPMKSLKEAFFQAIESSLGIEKGSLWDDDRGKAFAGYAPTLSSIGRLLADVRQPHAFTQQLEESQSPEAWNVIVEVIDHILKREQEEKMKIQIENVLSSMHIDLDEHRDFVDVVYGPDEQLTYLVQLFHQKPLVLARNLEYPNQAVKEEYQIKVEQLRSEHPFVQEGKQASEVLGSKVLTHATARGLLQESELDLLKARSRQPFLWRFFKLEILSAKEKNEEHEIDGNYLGCILNSYWHDAMESNDNQVTIRAARYVAEVAEVTIEGAVGRTPMSFSVMGPLRMYGQLKNTKMLVPGMEVHFEGGLLQTASGAAEYGKGHFEFRGRNAVVCAHLQYSCMESILYAGSTLWLGADSIVTSPSLKVRVAEGARYGWGGSVGRTEPFSRLDQPDPELEPKDGDDPAILRLVKNCAKDINTKPLVVYGDYTFPEDDNSFNKLKNEYREVFPQFLYLLKKHKFVERSKMATSGSRQKYRLHRFMWGDLRKAIEGRLNGAPEEGPEWGDFLRDCAENGFPELGM